MSEEAAAEMVELQLAINDRRPFADLRRTADVVTTRLAEFLDEVIMKGTGSSGSGSGARCCGRARRATTRPAASGTAPSTGSRR